MKKKVAPFLALAFVSILLLAFTTMNDSSHPPRSEKPTIIYIYDAYCGWCYGFSPVINRLHQEHSSQYGFLVLSGGLIRGERIGPMDKSTAEYIRKATPRLEEYTGVKVSDTYLAQLDNPSRRNNSNIPARALVVLRKYAPERSVEFASWLQKKLFNDVADLSKEEVYKEAATAFGLNPDTFIREMQAAQPAVDAEFEMVQSWGINGFPAVILDRGDTLIALSNGYAPFEELNKALQRAMELKIK